MAVSMRAQVSVTRASRRSAVVAQAHKVEAPLAAVVLAPLAAAALLAQPAQAGVVIEQPALKKVFQSSEAPAAPVERPFRQTGAAPSLLAEATAGLKKAEAPKPKKVESSGAPDILDPRAIALPASVVAIAGLGLAASKVDEGFSEWINESGALVRKSDNFAGFEEDIKGPNYLAPAGAAVKKGTTKVAAKTGTKKIGKTEKKSGGLDLGGFFKKN